MNWMMDKLLDVYFWVLDMSNRYDEYRETKAYKTLESILAENGIAVSNDTLED